jgi:hypothetical protein
MLLWRPVVVNSQTVFGLQDYDFCMEIYFKWLLVTMLVMLVTHAVPGKLFARHFSGNRIYQELR